MMNRNVRETNQKDRNKLEEYGLSSCKAKGSQGARLQQSYLLGKLSLECGQWKRGRKF
jgi:hypothetical protein